jgi:GrpB-like predicted nucleotidyltransferase (UPF0157 family)
LDRGLPSEAEVQRRTAEMRARMTNGRSLFVGQSDPEPIALTDASAAWPERYARLRDRLAFALGSGVRIEHIGSTSIAGIGAKPIIDILVSVPDLTDESRFVPAIESVGVQLRMREPDRGHVYFRDTQPRTVHIHVCQVGSKWERDHLLFRDYLRGHPEAARAYQAMKRAAADAYGDDRIAYTEAKGPFIERVLASAEEWAERIGWAP